MIKAHSAHPPALTVATWPEPGEERPVQWWEPLTAWVLALLVFVALMPHVLDRLNPVTGDEPFYLVTAISLWQDHDLDETNNYEQRDYWQFAPSCQDMRRPGWGLVGDPPVYNVSGVLAPGLRSDCKDVPLPLEVFATLPPHFSKDLKREGSYTKHGLGLSFMAAPFFAAGGRPVVVVLIAALAALLGVNMWLLAFETTGHRRVAWLTWGLLMFSSPVLCYAFLIFPATPAALLVAYSWRRLRLAARAQAAENAGYRPVNGPGRAALIGLCLGLLPWLHSVYLIISLMLFGYWWLGGRTRQFKRNLFGAGKRLSLRAIFPAVWSPVAMAGLFVPLILTAALFIAYYVYYYGAPLPNTQDHAGFAAPAEVPLAVLGLLFDQKYGLLIYAPLYLLALTGLVLLGLRTPLAAENQARRSDLFWLAAVALPYVLVIADYKQWWGEWCPPARYLMPVVPLLAVPLSLALCELRGRFFQFVGVTAALWSLGVSGLFMYNPHLMYNWQHNKPAISLQWLELNVEWLKTARLGRWFPSYVNNLQLNGDQPNWPVAAAWVSAALGIITILLISHQRTVRLSRAKGWPAEEAG